MKVIDHDPGEKPGRRFSLGKWKFAVWAVIAALWALQWREGFDWDQLCIGVATGLVFAYTVVDVHLSSGGSVRDL